MLFDLHVICFEGRPSKSFFFTRKAVIRSFFSGSARFFFNISCFHRWSKSLAFLHSSIHPFHVLQSRVFQSKNSNIILQSFHQIPVIQFDIQIHSQLHFFVQNTLPKITSFWQLDFAYKKPNIKRADRKCRGSRSFVREKCFRKLFESKLSSFSKVQIF